MNSSAVPPAIPIASAAVPAQFTGRLWPALTIGPILVWLADFLFWRQTPGFTLGLYFCTVALVVFALHARPGQRWRAGIACGLMGGAAMATAFETSFTNTLVLIGLLAVVVGESCYREIAGTAWARWSEALLSWVCAPGRWPWFFGRLGSNALVSVGMSKASGDVIARALQAIAPAACLGLVFLIVFQLGNAVFKELCNRVYTGVIDWLQNFDLSFDHLLFWFALSTLMLAFLQPRKGTEKPRIWTRQWSRVGRSDRTVAIWQSRSILFVINALFFAVNTIDVSYLWWHAELPKGVTHSEFLHSGVASLTFAALLSAVVLATLFQQSTEITRARGIKALALFWIVQNLVLIAGVFLRLKLYVEAYELSTARVYVGCFLLLVTAGFVLLALHVVREGSLNRLIWHNALAVFVLFYILQFPDVGGLVAQFNVDQWRKDRSRTLDFEYLENLGPSGWPALCSVATTEDRRRGDVIAVRQIVLKIARAEHERLAHADWRSFEIRRRAASQAVTKAADQIAAPL
ncbi:hypothetical protein CfE428DRAFT_2013 [Chthoniobacter flavus Ellin428]|uniref:Uncharacterized protein n=1 Tax=Chthoniobacter flavus Ellin428 TaxID=497964 RepID=B4CZC5_9BACT|nr:DUF4173 domain-containing protein [Chthoniobacter flavus]EDY20816.1 hypothetical protein CfE428DRAFT_2013 [Chthoniobacter flavus Ellin428]TCO89707.1 uncharacterized protein DUF4173 [Chthoniobacter flavus]